jgi:hypothetical protein
MTRRHTSLRVSVPNPLHQRNSQGAACLAALLLPAVLPLLPASVIRCVRLVDCRRLGCRHTAHPRRHQTERLAGANTKQKAEYSSKGKGLLPSACKTGGLPRGAVARRAP